MQAAFEKIPITVSKKELIELLNISSDTLITWLNKIPNFDHKRKRIFNPIETRIIFSHLGIIPE